MLLRTSLVGFLVGVVLACAYDAFVGGCGTALGTIPLFLIGNIVEELFGTVFADHNPWLSTGITAFRAWSFSLSLELHNYSCYSQIPEQRGARRFRDGGPAYVLCFSIILCISATRVPVKCISDDRKPVRGCLTRVPIESS